MASPESTTPVISCASKSKLRCAKPTELPIQAPVKFDLVINMKAAKALGLDVSWQLQQLADEVIE